MNFIYTNMPDKKYTLDIFIFKTTASVLMGIPIGCIDAVWGNGYNRKRK